MFVMDLIIFIEFWLAEIPLDTYLKLIGSVLGGGVLLGFILHACMGRRQGA